MTRVTRDMDWTDPETVDQICAQAEQQPGCSAHASLPCTAWSTWQESAIHKYGSDYLSKLEARREISRAMLRSFIRLAEIILMNGGHISFEWPKNCTGLLIKELLIFITKWNLFSVIVHGCPFGMQNDKGEPLLKQWRFITSSSRMASALEPFTCQHLAGFQHGKIEGSTTGKTAFYPRPL